MRDALGGIVNIQLIAVFIVLVSGYLAFSVNYTKAFRVKNAAINAIERYEGMDDRVDEKMTTYTNSIGYNPGNMTARENDYCDNATDYVECHCADSGYCWKKYIVSSTSTEGYNLNKTYYNVAAYILLDIPVVKLVLPARILRVSGDTKTIVK